MKNRTKAIIIGRGQSPARAIEMSSRHYALLESVRHKQTLERQYVDRIDIVLRGSVYGGGSQSNNQIKRELGISLNTIKTWRSRWEMSYAQLQKYEAGKEGKGVSDNALTNQMLRILADLPRSGSPRKISLAQEQQIVALACENPEDYGLAVTSWTHERLASVAMEKGIVSSISSRHVGTFLKKKPA